MAEKHKSESLEYGANEKELGLRSSSIDGNDGLRTVDAGFSPDQVEAHYDQKEVRRILRKVDFRLIPLLGVLYLYVRAFTASSLPRQVYTDHINGSLAYIDRSNIGNAKIAGMSEDLNLYGMRYNTALTVFFVPYALFEVLPFAVVMEPRIPVAMLTPYRFLPTLSSRCSGRRSGSPSSASAGAWS
jgi:hypothetical protein